MSIAAQRFKFLDQETNVPIADFRSQFSSDLLNAQINLVTDLSANIHDFINSNAVIGDVANLMADGLSSVNAIAGTVASDIGAGLSSIANMAGNLGVSLNASLSLANKDLGITRSTRNALTSKIDLSGISSAALGAAAVAIAGTNQQAINALNSLPPPCKTGLLAKIGSNNRKPPTLNCSTTGLVSNLNTGPCTNNIKNIINQISNGNYTPTIIDLGSLENSAALLCMAGYSLGLCGLFNVLTAGISDLGSLSRIAATVIGDAVGRSDIATIIDVGLNLRGANVKSIIPGVAAMIMGAYIIPPTVTDAGLCPLGDTFCSAMDNISPDWQYIEKGPDEDVPDPTMLSSSCYADDINNNDISNTFLAQSTVQPSMPYDPSSITNTITNTPDSSYFYTATQFNTPDPCTNLSDNYGPVVSF